MADAIATLGVMRLDAVTIEEVETVLRTNAVFLLLLDENLIEESAVAFREKLEAEFVCLRAVIFSNKRDDSGGCLFSRSDSGDAWFDLSEFVGMIQEHQKKRMHELGTNAVKRKRLRNLGDVLMFLVVSFLSLFS